MAMKNNDMSLMDKLKGKRILILGGAAQALKVVTTAKSMGLYTIVADIVEHTESKLAADEALSISVTDSDALIKWCEKNPVDGVLNFNIDFAQHSHQRICAHFGFPCYGTEEQYDSFTDKSKFKEICVNNGIGVIPDFPDDGLQEIEYPVFVKPAESSGSRGGGICSTPEELKCILDTARSESRNGKVIIEKYLGGNPEVELVYFVEQGVPYLLYAGDRIPGKKEYGLNQQCACFVCPSKFMDLILKETHSRICGMLRRIGMKNGPVFFQGFVDGETVRLYDVGIRFPGDEFVSVLKELTGIDLVGAMIKYALYGDSGLIDADLDKLYLLNHRYGALYFLQGMPGVIGIYDGLSEIRHLPFTVAALQKHFAGDTIEDTKDLGRRIGEIAIKGNSDIGSIVKAIIQARECLRVEDINGGNMLIDSFDIEDLVTTNNKYRYLTI